MTIMKNELSAELTGNILPFWINKMQDSENGGFYGRIDGNNVLHKQANKGAVLNARILWTFSAAYRIYKDPQYLEMATRAFHYILDHFMDPVNGGVYWELDYTGKPVNTKKQVYAQGFALYGFSEYYRSTGDLQALEKAKELFFIIEKYCKDPVLGGYFEAFTADWNEIKDMRLSNKDANEKKSMNTHLHILEPYTNLCRIWKNEQLDQAQRDLTDIFIHKILDENTGHLQLFFAEDWTCRSSIVSYGHDIEASWLLYEAAVELNDEKLISNIKNISIRIVEAAIEGIALDGGLIYELDNGHTDTDRHWWVQAEAVVGFFYAYQNTGNKKYLNLMENTWKYIREHLIDNVHGEWYWSICSNKNINMKEDKAGFWKCPYHNSRMCMEIM